MRDAFNESAKKHYEGGMGRNIPHL